MAVDPRRVFCASSLEAQSMTDEDFWYFVFTTEGMPEEDDYDPNHEAMDDFLTEQACSICGQVGACAWDAEGLPLVHPVSDNGYFALYSGEGEFLRLFR